MSSFLLEMMKKYYILSLFLWLSAMQASWQKEDVTNIQAVKGKVKYSDSEKVNIYPIAMKLAKKSSSSILLILGATGAATSKLANVLTENLQEDKDIKKPILFIDFQEALEQETKKKSKELLQEIIKTTCDAYIAKFNQGKEDKKQLDANKFKKQEIVLIMDHCELFFANRSFNPTLSFVGQLDLKSLLGEGYYPNMLIIAMCQREALGVSNELTFWKNRYLNAYSLLPWDQSRIEAYVQNNHRDITYQGPYDIPAAIFHNVVIPAYQKNCNIKNFAASWAWHETFFTKWFEQTSLQEEEKKAVQEMMKKIVMMQKVKGRGEVFSYDKTGWQFVFEQGKATWDFLLNAPIKNKFLNNDYHFLFPSLYDYILAKAFIKPFLLKKKDLQNEYNLWHKIDLNEHEYANTLTMLVEAAKAEETFKKKLMTTFNRSKNTKETANAFLILVKAGFLTKRELNDKPYKPNLQGINLQNFNLQGLDLRNINFTSADLRGANLQNAQLNDSHLEGVDFRGANLQGANLSGANLTSAELEGADLRNAILDNVNVRAARWARAKNLTLPRLTSEQGGRNHEDQEENNWFDNNLDHEGGMKKTFYIVIFLIVGSKALVSLIYACYRIRFLVQPTSRSDKK